MVFIFFYLNIYCFIFYLHKFINFKLCSQHCKGYKCFDFFHLFSLSILCIKFVSDNKKHDDNFMHWENYFVSGIFCNCSTWRDWLIGRKDILKNRSSYDSLRDFRFYFRYWRQKITVADGNLPFSEIK